MRRVAFAEWNGLRLEEREENGTCAVKDFEVRMKGDEENHAMASLLAEGRRLEPLVAKVIDTLLQASLHVDLQVPEPVQWEDALCLFLVDK